METLRTKIQIIVADALRNGTFYKVEYTDGNPVVDGTKAVPQSVSCNEVSGQVNFSAARAASTTSPVMANWRFDCLAEFTCEVDVQYYLLNEMGQLTFSFDNLLVTVTPTGEVRTSHPPRTGAHNGTKLTIGLTVNTRR